MPTLAQNLTLMEFLQLPETKPVREYIDGEIIEKPMPKGKHSRIQTQLSSRINGVLEPQKIALAFSELRCTFGGKSIVPDISVLTWANIPSDENGEIADTFLLAPDWAIEILSPEQSRTRVTKNILHCLQYKTQIGWLIDPLEQSVFVYLPEQLPEVLDDRDAVLPIPPFAGDLQLTLGEIWEWLIK